MASSGEVADCNQLNSLFCKNIVCKWAKLILCFQVLSIDVKKYVLSMHLV